MGYLFMDSFDGYGVNDLSKKYTSQGTDGNGGSTTLANGRRGTNGLNGSGNFGISTARIRWLQKNLPAQDDTFVFGTAYQYTGTSAFLSGTFTSGAWGDDRGLVSLLYLGMPHIWLWFIEDGTIGAFRGTTPTAVTRVAVSDLAVPQSTRVYLEVKIVVHNTDGVIQIRMDNELIMDYAGNTRNSQVSVNRWNALRFAGIAGSNLSLSYNYDDLYVFDGTGSDCNDFVGDQRIDAQQATADGTHQDSTPSTGSDRYEMINDSTPNGDTDYNRLSAAGQTDTFTFPDVPVPGAKVTAVQLNMYCAKEDAGPNDLKAVWRLGGTDYLSDARGATSSYSDRHFGWSRRPSDSGEITTADIDGQQFGYQKSS